MIDIGVLLGKEQGSKVGKSLILTMPSFGLFGFFSFTMGVLLLCLKHKYTHTDQFASPGNLPALTHLKQRM